MHYAFSALEVVGEFAEVPQGLAGLCATGASAAEASQRATATWQTRHIEIRTHHMYVYIYIQVVILLCILTMCLISYMLFSNMQV